MTRTKKRFLWGALVIIVAGGAVVAMRSRDADETFSNGLRLSAKWLVGIFPGKTSFGISQATKGDTE